MTFDYGQQLIIERGRAAGGIALELVEMLEEASHDLGHAECEAQDRLENKIDDLEDKVSEWSSSYEEVDEHGNALLDLLDESKVSEEIKEAMEKFREAMGDMPE